MLKIEIQDDSCKDNEVIQIFVPLETDKMDIMFGIQTLYPKATSVSIEVVEAGSNPV